MAEPGTAGEGVRRPRLASWMAAVAAAMLAGPAWAIEDTVGSAALRLGRDGGGWVPALVIGGVQSVGRGYLSPAVGAQLALAWRRGAPELQVLGRGGLLVGDGPALGALLGDAGLRLGGGRRLGVVAGAAGLSAPLSPIAPYVEAGLHGRLAPYAELEPSLDAGAAAVFASRSPGERSSRD